MSFMRAVGLKSMVVSVWVSPTGFAFVGVACAACGERVCQYSVTDLEELESEYGAHISTSHPQERK